MKKLAIAAQLYTLRDFLQSPAEIARTLKKVKGIEKFGTLIKCVHAKDTLLQTSLTLHLQEMRPGSGTLDYRTLLVELERADREMPLIIEHLKVDEDYSPAAEYIRAVATSLNVEV